MLRRALCLLLAALLVHTAASAGAAPWTPPQIVVEGTLGGAYRVPGKGVASRFVQYYDYTNRRFLQTVDAWLFSHPVASLWVGGQAYVTIDNKCTVFAEQPYPVPPELLAAVNGTYFGTEVVALGNGSQVPAEHWGGVNLLCRNLSLHFAMYWQPVAAPLPVRHAHIAVFSDGASELYDFDAWSLSVPAPSVFNVPPDCHAPLAPAPAALPFARLAELALGT